MLSEDMVALKGVNASSAVMLHIHTKNRNST